MRKALIVGVDYYATLPRLSGCVNDANAVRSVIERHADGTLNFVNPDVLLGTSAAEVVTKRRLKQSVEELFADDSEIALFYFAGHGHVETTGGYLCTSDAEAADDGLALSEVMTLANKSEAQNKVIILDSCHSGEAGNDPIDRNMSELAQGVTILTASTSSQSALEVPSGGAGVFTSLLVDALNGAAANLMGDVTPGSVYAHIDQSLGPWTQRPVFKTNVKKFISLRRAEPPISFATLRALTAHFPKPDHRFQLDPSYEPERTPEQAADPAIPAPDPAHTKVFAILQEYARVNLVRPVNEKHMFHAAWHSESCELTVVGQHYWNLVDKRLI